MNSRVYFEKHCKFMIFSMTDSAIGDSTVTSPTIGGNLVDDSVQMLSPTRHRGNFDNLRTDIFLHKASYPCLKYMIDLSLSIGEMNEELPTKSQCSSLGSDREENFESYGENDVGIDGDEK